VRARRRLWLVLGWALALPACESADRPQPALPAGPHVVEIQMRDYSFEYDPAIPGGRVLFRVVNSGTVPHNLSLLPLSDDIPAIDEQLRGSVRRALAPFAGIRARPPGGSTTFAVDLAPGVRYAFVCFVDDPDGVSHSLRGMSSEFRTPGASGPPGVSTSSSSATHMPRPTGG